MDIVVWLRSLDLGKLRRFSPSVTPEMKELGVASDVRERLVAIVRHYRSLAKIEQSIADQRPNKSVALIISQ